MASATKLAVWNAALREIAAHPLPDTTTVNTTQNVLDGAWNLAIEHVLAMKDWGFARRRAALAGIADTSFPPYTFRMAKPTDYLRKCWMKNAANDDYQVEHAEIAAVFYALQNSAVLEYMSDHTDNYNPANWPPHFTKVLTLYLASLVAPKIARAGAEDLGRLNAQMRTALEDADDFEAVFLVNTAIAANRQPVMRRALEFMGQVLAGSVPVHAQADKLRWHMNRAWDHCLKYVLEQGAWNFATQRALLAAEGALTADTVVPGSTVGIIEGYSYGTATSTASDIPVSGFAYAFPLPDDFLHKVWIKASPYHDTETTHQFIGQYLFLNVNSAIMEYVALSDYAVNPENWSANFLEAVAAYLALTVTPELMIESDSKGRARVNAVQLRDKLEMVFRVKLADAKLRDAIQQDALRMPLGRFAKARLGSIGTTNLRRYN